MSVLCAKLRAIGLALASTVVFLSAVMVFVLHVCAYTWIEVWQNIETKVERWSYRKAERALVSLWHNGTVAVKAVSIIKLRDWSLFSVPISSSFPYSLPLSLVLSFFFLVLTFTFSLRLYLSHFHSCDVFVTLSKQWELSQTALPSRRRCSAYGVFVGLRTLAEQGSGPSTTAQPTKISRNLNAALCRQCT